MKNKKYLFLLLSPVVFMSACSDFDKKTAPPFRTEQLMTGQDVLNKSYSNISITNATTAAVTASGLFIASYDVNDCSACFGSVMGGNNAGGAMVEPVTFQAGQSIKVGQNYLYNLIYNGLYYVQTNIGTPCQLPGCSWTGDTAGIKWCLSIGVMSRTASYTSSSYMNGTNAPARAVPYGYAVESNPFNYNYSLIDPATLGAGSACLGPITCNDETLTCVVSAAQSQSFQAY